MKVNNASKIAMNSSYEDEDDDDDEIVNSMMEGGDDEEPAKGNPNTFPTTIDVDYRGGD
jgi:hypothetical protein